MSDQAEPWRDYLRQELERGRNNQRGVDRFERYLADFQGANSSVYVSDLVDCGSPEEPREFYALRYQFNC